MIKHLVGDNTPDEEDEPAAPPAPTPAPVVAVKAPQPIKKADTKPA